MADPLECVRKHAKPYYVFWRHVTKLNYVSFLSRLMMKRSEIHDIAIREIAGDVDWQEADCCDETAPQQRLQHRIRSSRATCYTMSLKLTPCELDLFKAKNGAEFNDVVRAAYEKIWTGAFKQIIRATMAAVTKDIVLVSDTKRGRCNVALKPEEDGVLTASVPANLIGEALLSKIYENFVRDGIGNVDEITLLLPFSVTFLLSEASHERNKYCCKEADFGDTNVGNLLTHTVIYRGVKFYIYAENQSYFTLPNDGTHTLGVAFVRNRMVLHSVDFYRDILSRGTNSRLLTGGPGDIASVAVEGRDVNSFVPISFLGGMSFNVLRASSNAAMLLEFTNADIEGKTVANSLTLVNAITTSAKPVTYASDAPDLDNSIISASATMASDTPVSNKRK